MAFDPYHKWLGIRPTDQPPNHYRLLGIDLFESDPEVIDAAANRQMAYLQQRATGEHGARSQQLLSEIAVARLCLLDTEKRKEYDEELRQAKTNQSQETPPATPSTAKSGASDPVQSAAAPPRQSIPARPRLAPGEWNGGILAL